MTSRADIDAVARDAPMHRRCSTGIHHDNTFGTPEEDAFRRDFTINALFYESPRIRSSTMSAACRT